MEAFPFSDAEWDSLKPLALSILNAGSADDDALVASLRLDLLDLLAGLRGRHGDHPVLLETIADYTDDEPESAALYRQAAAVAGANGLPTLSIRVALAFTLMKLGEPGAAVEELRACGADAAGGTADERAEWANTLAYAADYAQSDVERVALYRRAAEVAASHGVPTLRYQLHLARLLLDTGEPAAALAELRACEGELAGGDESDRATWAELHAEARRADPGRESRSGDS